MTAVFWKFSVIFGYESAIHVGRNVFLLRSFLCKYCPDLYCDNTIQYTKNKELLFSYSDLKSLVSMDLTFSLSLRIIHPQFEDIDCMGDVNSRETGL